MRITSVCTPTKVLTVFALLLVLVGRVESTSICPGEEDIPSCNCQLAASGLSRVTCHPNNGTMPGDILERFSTIGERIDTLTIVCGNDTTVKVLTQIPKLECRSLRILKCGIHQVSENAFDALAETLEEIILSDNQIRNFPFLKKLRRLQVINLDNNQLHDIPERTFEGIETIRQIRVKGNQICLLLPNALNETKATLELLDLSNNCFTAVPAQNLRNAQSLTHLSLAHNHIAEMQQMHLMNLPKLMELRLNGNRLTRISANAFMNVPELKVFVVKNNQLRKFESATLQAFKKLMYFDLSGNQLDKMPSFKDLPELVEINADQNNIEKIDTLTFSGTPKLRVISMQRNRISMISRNSFDTLNGLTALFLSNNSLKTLERTMFDGLKNLHFLSVSNNSIANINPMAFNSVPDLTYLDLSNNRIERIRAGTFAKLTKLGVLNLSNNTQLAKFEPGSFHARIGTVFLDGIELNCDDEMDWFIGYLVKNNVRTFVPNQSDIRCASPPQYAGHRLKDLMMTKANETLAGSMETLGFGQGANGQTMHNTNFLTRFLPAFKSPKSGSVPVLNSITQAMPSLREIPGLSMLTQRYGPPPSDKNLDSAIEQFTEPLVNFATGSHSDINHLLKTIPNLVVSVPGFGDVDISKLPPGLVQNVLNGGDVPGIPRETLDKIVKQYMERLYYAAARAQQLEPVGVEAPPPSVDTGKYLRPLGELPNELVTNVMKGQPLPHLNELQTQTIKNYYTAQAPIGGADSLNISSLISPKMLQMFRLLPKGFNISEIPSEVIRSVQAGEIPDMTKLPPYLLQHFKDNLEEVMRTMDVGGSKSEVSIDELLRKLPKFEPVDVSTFSPYDINDVDSDLVVSERENAARAQSARLYAAIALGLVGALSVAVLMLFCYRLAVQKRQTASRSVRLEDVATGDGGLENGGFCALSTVDASPAKTIASTRSFAETQNNRSHVSETAATRHLF